MDDEKYYISRLFPSSSPGYPGQSGHIGPNVYSIYCYFSLSGYLLWNLEVPVRLTVNWVFREPGLELSLPVKGLQGSRLLAGFLEGKDLGRDETEEGLSPLTF